MSRFRRYLLIIIFHWLTNFTTSALYAASTAIAASSSCGPQQNYYFPIGMTISDDADRFNTLISSIDRGAPATIHFSSGNYYFRSVLASQIGGLPTFNTATLVDNFNCGITLDGEYPGTVATGGSLGVTPETSALYYPQFRLAPPITTIYMSTINAYGLTLFNNYNIVFRNIAFNFEDGVTGTKTVPYTYATVTSVNEVTSNEQQSSFDITLVDGYPPITTPNSSKLTPMFQYSNQPLIVVTDTDSSGIQYYNVTSITLPNLSTAVSGSCGGATNASWAMNYSCASGECYHIYPNVCQSWTVAEGLGSDAQPLSPSGIAVGSKILILARSNGDINLVSNYGKTVFNNIYIYSSPGNALSFFKNEGNISIKHLNIYPDYNNKSGLLNPLAVNGDGVLSLSGHAAFDIAFSSFRGIPDDDIDISNRMSLFSTPDADGNPYDRVIMSVNGQNGLQLYDDFYSFDYAPGDQLSIVDRGSMNSQGINVWNGFVWTGVVQSATLISANETVPQHWLIVPTPGSQALTGDAETQLSLVNSNLALTNSGNGSTIATVRRSTFYPSRGGIVLRVPISYFRFNYAVGAIPPIAQGGADFSNWGEGTVSPSSTTGTDVIYVEGNVFNAAPGALVNNFSAPLIEVGAVRSDGGGFLNTPAYSPLFTVIMKGNWLNNARMSPFVTANSNVVNKKNNIYP